jgi:uncharacterized membrane protein YgaE (UPF0421/DUF939 family)
VRANLRKLPVAGRRRIDWGGRASFARAFRLTIASAAAYVVAQRLSADAKPVTAALTALLIVQVTFFGTVTDTVRRIVSVLTGVGLAVAASLLVGLTWWSLASIVLVSILIGQALRLGPHLLEVPISAMLILAAGGAGVNAIDRVVETLIGAVVGVLVNVVVPQRPRTHSAGLAVERFADAIARLLDRVASALRDGPVSRDMASEWLDEVRELSRRVEFIERELDEAAESRRLNPRAVGLPDTTPDLRTGLQALEHVAIALRAVFRSLTEGPDVIGDEARPDGSGDDDLRAAIAVLVADIAKAVRDFGALVRAEGDELGQIHVAELDEALEAAREARVRLTELLLVDAHDAFGLWQRRGSLLAGVERVLAELDAEERRRRTQRRRELAAAARGPGAQAAERLRTTTRRVVAEKRALRNARGATRDRP